MYSVSRMLCCGLREISGLSYYRNTEEDFQEIMKALLVGGVIIHSPGGPDVMRCGALIFTQAKSRPNYGLHFAKRVRDLGLGRVVELDKFTNPNTQHVIRTFVWTLDKKALVAYFTKHNWFSYIQAATASVPPQVIR